MRIPLILLTVVIIICVALDLFIWRRARADKSHPELYSRLHVIIAAVSYLVLAVAVAMPRRGGDEGDLAAIMWMLFSFASLYFAKAVYVVFALAASLPRLWGARRWKWLDAIGCVLAVLLFGGMWWGALVNRFRIDMREVDTPVAGLQSGFDGYRVVQISDLHTGTYGNDTTYLSRLVDRVNDIDADLVVFTGDIVNRRSDELRPHIPVLSRLTARDGVYAILGNHDYGDYYNWPSAEAKTENMRALYRMFDDMGWTLLNNSTAMIHSRGDSLALIGVENIGDPPFPVYGSLDKAYPAGADGVAKILLSHNPAHWTSDIADGRKPNDIGLTLAGHTHAMQIELLGLSPAAFRYPTWGGMYTDGDGRRLYVNIGIGTVGMPMRLGATPEVTVFTLHPDALK